MVYRRLGNLARLARMAGRRALLEKCCQTGVGVRLSGPPAPRRNLDLLDNGNPL